MCPNSYHWSVIPFELIEISARLLLGLENGVLTEPSMNCRHLRLACYLSGSHVVAETRPFLSESTAERKQQLFDTSNARQMA
jgi:hypothetical protein